jgi:hypothetical protein
MKLNRLCIALLTLVGFATAATAAPFGGAYYETFAGSEIVAIDLANPSLLLGIKTGNISNVAVGGDTVYYQDGRRIFAGNANLSSTSLFHTNGAVATDLAINVAGNAYYESFGTEIVAIELANPSHLLGIRTGNITNISVSGGKVYYQDGSQNLRRQRGSFERQPFPHQWCRTNGSGGRCRQQCVLRELRRRDRRDRAGQPVAPAWDPVRPHHQHHGRRWQCVFSGRTENLARQPRPEHGQPVPHQWGYRRGHRVDAARAACVRRRRAAQPRPAGVGPRRGWRAAPAAAPFRGLDRLKQSRSTRSRPAPRVVGRVLLCSSTTNAPGLPRSRQAGCISSTPSSAHLLPARLLQPAQQGRIERVRIRRLGDVIIHPGCQATLAVLVEGIGGQGQNRDG